MSQQVGHPGELSLAKLLATLTATLHPAVYVFAVVRDEDKLPPWSKVQMLFREADSEGVTVILTQEDATAAGLEYCFPCRKITLDVTSSLDAVGFIAVVATRLAAHEQTLRDCTNTVIPDQVEKRDHELAAAAQEEHLPSTIDASELWQEVLEQSDEETKKKIKQLDQTDTLIHIDQLIDLIRDKRDAFKVDTPSINIHGKEVIWRDCAARVISILTVLGDVASQFAPSPSSAVWSALKVLLKTNVTQCAEMVAVLGCIEKVLPLVKRGAIYEHVFLRERSNDSCKSSINLREALVEAYKQALKLLVQAVRKVEENNITRFWSALQNHEEVVGLIKDFRDAEDRVIKDAHACHVEQGKVNHDEILERFGCLDRPLQEFAHKISRAVYEHALNFAHRNWRLAFATWEISSMDTVSVVGSSVANRTRFVYHWPSSVIVSSPEDKTVGAGKTILASHVIDNCMDNNARESPAIGAGLAYFYYSKADQETREQPSTFVFQSFVKQLFMLPSCPEKLHINLIQRIEDVKKAHRTFLSYKECENLLLDFVNEVSHTFLILDGLDEFPEWDACEIIIALTNLVRISSGLVHVFVSSRNEDHIRKTFRATEYQQPFLEINIGSENQADIERFIEKETKQNFNRYSADKQRHLIDRLTGGANGMSWPAILERLDNLPKGLADIYDQLYDRNEGSDRTYLQRAVKWVTFAYEPLSTEALLSVIQLGQSPDGTLQIDDRADEAEIESICRHLISKDTNGHWKFAHASVDEYFQDVQNERLGYWVGNSAQVDLAILLVLLFISYEEWPRSIGYSARMLKRCDDSSSTSQSHELDPQSFLRSYVDNYWMSHVETTQHLPIKRPQVLQLLQPFMPTGKLTYKSSPQYQKWIQIAAAGRTDIYTDALPADNSIFGLVALGLFPLLDKRGIGHLDLEKTNATHRSLLAIAARHGHTLTCARLVDLGCEINRGFQVIEDDPLSGPKVYRSTALFEAVKEKNADCVEMLLKRKADANLDTDTRALCRAAEYDDTTILKLLLDYGARPNAICRDCSFNYAIERANHSNRRETMKLLTQAGARFGSFKDSAGMPHFASPSSTPRTRRRYAFSISLDPTTRQF
ncbi:hypothetical protein G7054_g7688 [Neopestalotiopsis clavispora]|nr:hypothetical protein G7054_g7688 [Neopestalotiopsis clavispora]